MSNKIATTAKHTMRWNQIAIGVVALIALVCCLLVIPCAQAEAPQSEANQPGAGSTARAVGTVKAISGNILTLSTDTGSTVQVTVPDSARVVRIAPGQKDLKDATSSQFRDVQIGDRILARGTASADGPLAASSVVVMKQADVTAKQDREREDWQKRGVGGLVSSVTASSGSVVISTQTAGESKPVTVNVAKGTIIRRYAPDSVKFDDAKPSTLDEIKAGDQLRARGARSADGTELAAEEIVSGSFRNVAGTVISADASSNTLTVMDLLSKKPVVLKITPDSQLRKLPLMFAQRIAVRLRGETPTGVPGSGPPGGSGASTPKSAEGGAPGMGGPRAGGPPDFQQMLKRMPPVALAELEKGDAIMVVATEGTASTQPIAITLLSGVEPILSAAPSGGRAAMLLSPWTLGGGGGDAAAAGP